MGLITIHNHIHLPGDDRLDRIEHKLNQLMALTEQQFNEVLNRIDTATTGIANKITALQDEIKGAGLPASVEESVLAKLGNLATTLEGLAKDPENPTPETPAEEQPQP
jgi:hypothetical protein